MTYEERKAWAKAGKWKRLAAPMPPADLELEWSRPEWTTPIITKRQDMDAMFNLAGIYWRPIARPRAKT